MMEKKILFVCDNGIRSKYAADYFKDKCKERNIHVDKVTAASILPSEVGVESLSAKFVIYSDIVFVMEAYMKASIHTNYSANLDKIISLDVKEFSPEEFMYTHIRRRLEEYLVPGKLEAAIEKAAYHLPT